MRHYQVKAIYGGEIVRVRSMPCYLIVTELQDFTNEGKPFPITYALSKAGDYIGDVRTAHRLVNRFGISIFERRRLESRVCSLGYNLQKRRWFWWSHRAIASFKKKRDAERFAASVS